MAKHSRRAMFKWMGALLAGSITLAHSAGFCTKFYTCQLDQTPGKWYGTVFKLSDQDPALIARAKDLAREQLVKRGVRPETIQYYETLPNPADPFQRYGLVGAKGQV